MNKIDEIKAIFPIPISKIRAALEGTSMVKAEAANILLEYKESDETKRIDLPEFEGPKMVLTNLNEKCGKNFSKKIKIK